MINMNTEFGLSVLFDGFLAAIAAIGFAVISNPPKKAVFIAALLAAVGHACRYYLLHQTPLDLTSSTLIAAFTIGMGSMWFAKLIHCPAEVFSFPSLLPMIPGMYAYKTILALIRFMKNDDTAGVATVDRRNFPEWLDGFIRTVCFGHRSFAALVYIL